MKIACPTPMESRLLDIVSQMHLDHQRERAELKSLITRLQQEMTAQRSKIDQLANQQAVTAQSLNVLAPLWGINLPQQQ